MPLKKKNILDAIKKAKDKSKKRKFSQSVELVLNLQDVDPKKQENRIQELIELPYPAGKENKICVIASGEMALKAKKAGASMVIGRSDLESLIGDKKRQKEFAKTYDFFIAEAPSAQLLDLGERCRLPYLRQSI